MYLSNVTTTHNSPFTTHDESNYRRPHLLQKHLFHPVRRAYARSSVIRARRHRFRPSSLSRSRLGGAVSRLADIQRRCACMGLARSSGSARTFTRSPRRRPEPRDSRARQVAPRYRRHARMVTGFSALWWTG